MKSYFDSGLLESEIMAMRMADYAAFQPQAIAILKKAGEPLTPNNIMIAQESLAIERRIVPPHWTGWIDCEKCGIRPAEKEYAGEKLLTCRWCFVSDEILGMDLSWTAHCNKMDAAYKRNGY